MLETPENFDPYHLIKYLSNQANLLCTPDDKSDEFKAGMSCILASVKNYFDPYWDKDLNGWISINNNLPYCHTVFNIDDYPGKCYPLQIITKDGLLRTAIFLEMKIPHHFHGEKLFWLCDIEYLNDKFIIHDISEDSLEIDEVKYWQPLVNPPKE